MSLAIQAEPQVELHELGAHPSSLRVLVVEDDPFTLTILKKRLLKEGHEIATAVNGREGLEMVEKFRPDLVLSDWMMPEMDGYQLCNEIKKRPDGRNIYFILLTAKDKNEDKISALDTGADEYLVKPCEGSELMARIRAAHRLLRLQKELTRSNEQLQIAYQQIDKEMQATSLIQRSLLPQSLPRMAGYAFAAHYQPSSVCSGDFYDMWPLKDGKLGMVIGDVSGHGSPAMVAMALTRTLMRIEIEKSYDPATLLYNINNGMFEHLPTNQYVTIFFGHLDPPSGTLTFSSAGHNPPLLIDPTAGRCEFLKGCEGFPIKLVQRDASYEDHQAHLEHGQTLLLYTDGLVEAFNTKQEQFGSERLTETVRRVANQPPDAIQAAILKALEEYCDGIALQDDLSMLIVQRNAV